MGMPVLVYGKSGSGKTRSLKNFGEEEIFLVNVQMKDLPFRKKFKYVSFTNDIDKILEKASGANEHGVKTVVIDDAGYLMTHYFMEHHREKSGSQSFDMYDDIADLFFNLVMGIKTKLPKDTIVYIILHEDTDDYGDTKLRTIGKLLDRKVCVEGMVTICLRCMSENGRHYFRTATNGNDITKSPEEMFDKEEIDNDLKAVDTTIREYWGL